MNRRNVVCAAEASTLDGNQWDYFDSLPETIRRAMCETTYDLDALEIRRLLDFHGRKRMNKRRVSDLVVAMIRQNEITEISVFETMWPTQFGQYPHVAAGATIQRYDRRLTCRLTGAGSM
jgi:hypothetical protein